MDEIAQHGVVAGFLHVLSTHPEVFAGWQQCERNHGAIGAFVQKTMGLASPPSAQELESMSKYSQQSLKPQIAAVQSLASTPSSMISLGLDHEG